MSFDRRGLARQGVWQDQRVMPGPGVNETIHAVLDRDLIIITSQIQVFDFGEFDAGIVLECDTPLFGPRIDHRGRAAIRVMQHMDRVVVNVGVIQIALATDDDNVARVWRVIQRDRAKILVDEKR